MEPVFEKPSEALVYWLKAKGVTAYQLCKETTLAQSRISEILTGRRRVTAETATVLGAFFDTGAHYWLNIQTKHDLNESGKAGAEHQICSGEIRLGGYAMQCHVLAGDRRVISATGFLAHFGIRSSAYAGGSNLAKLIDSPYLKSDRIKSLIHTVSNPIKFVNHYGTVTHGYEGETLVEYCKALLEVRRVGGLPAAAKPYAEAAEMFVIALAKVGIVALIDEATGFQALRNRDGLQRLFDIFLLKEYAAWAKRFPDEFYMQMFRLKKWKWEALKSQKPPVVGKITNDIVYRRLAPGVLEELQRLNPLLETGRRSVKHHQYLSADVGHPALNQHLYALCALMRASADWNSFYHMIQMTFPMRNEGVQMDFNDLPKHDEE